MNNIIGKEIFNGQVKDIADISHLVCSYDDAKMQDDSETDNKAESIGTEISVVRQPTEEKASPEDIKLLKEIDTLLSDLEYACFGNGEGDNYLFTMK